MNDLHNYSTDSAVYNEVLSLLRSSVWGEERFPYSRAEGVDIKEVNAELKHHTVQYLPIDILAREYPEYSDRYITADAKKLMRFDRIMSEQMALCGMLRDNGIPCAVVKGAAVAEQYLRPQSRALGDIDLLVSPEDFDLACRLIGDGAEYLDENYRHKEYRRNGTIVEVHRGFCGIRNDEIKALFDGRLFAALDKAEAVTVDNYTFYRLPVVEHGLTLIEHIDIHLEGGLGLRQIVDWMVFTDLALTDRVWETDFSPFLRKIGLEKLAITVTRMCQMYLGLRDDISWCAEADEALCEELMNYILRQGNFGRKNESGANRATAVISSSKNVFSLFRVLQSLGCENWEALERLPFLKPFAWAHQILRYVRLGLKTEHPTQFLKDAITRSRAQDGFFEALSVLTISQRGKKK